MQRYIMIMRKEHHPLADEWGFWSSTYLMVRLEWIFLKKKTLCVTLIQNKVISIRQALVDLSTVEGRWFGSYDLTSPNYTLVPERPKVALVFWIVWSGYMMLSHPKDCRHPLPRKKYTCISLDTWPPLKTLFTASLDIWRSFHHPRRKRLRSTWEAGGEWEGQRLPR